MINTLQMTPYDAKFLLHRRGSFRFYAGLNHKMKMKRAKDERKKLRLALLSHGVHPIWVVNQLRAGR
jgi:hypothetical protein